MLLSAYLCNHEPECLRDLPLNLDPGLSEIVVLPEFGRALATFYRYDKTHSRNNLRRHTFWLTVSKSVMEKEYQSNSDHDSKSVGQRLLTAWWIRRREWVRLVPRVVTVSQIHHFKSRIG